MNKRIRLLAEQCQIESYAVNGELLEIGVDAEKFAQSIVQSVLELVVVEQDHTYNIYHGYYGA